VIGNVVKTVVQDSKQFAMIYQHIASTFANDFKIVIFIFKLCFYELTTRGRFRKKQNLWWFGHFLAL
jgi:hypothetical protein